MMLRSPTFLYANRYNTMMEKHNRKQQQFCAEFKHTCR
jgi:hypothetical protein